MVALHLASMKHNQVLGSTTKVIYRTKMSLVAPKRWVALHLASMKHNPGK
jgi:hypothetical protein